MSYQLFLKSGGGVRQKVIFGDQGRRGGCPKSEFPKRAELPPRYCAMYSSLSFLDLPEPVLLGLSVSRCLDEVPLGLLLVELWQLLGQALKEQVFVKLVELGNLNI